MMRMGTMRRWVTLVAVAALVFAACSDDDGPEAGGGSSTSTTTAPASTTTTEPSPVPSPGCGAAFEAQDKERHALQRRRLLLGDPPSGIAAHHIQRVDLGAGRRGEHVAECERRLREIFHN